MSWLLVGPTILLCLARASPYGAVLEKPVKDVNMENEPSAPMTLFHCPEGHLLGSPRLLPRALVQGSLTSFGGKLVGLASV